VKLTALPFPVRKKIFKFKLILHKYLLKSSKPLRSIYDIYLTPAYKDVTFKYYFKGTYGTFFSDLLKNFKTHAVFVDIGANQGLFTILAAKNSNFKEVVSFEPSSRTSSLLRKNLKVNDVKNCRVVQAAISDKNKELVLHSTDGHSGLSTLRSVESKEEKAFEKINAINHVKIDSLIPKHNCYIVKIDVEGHEEVVINELVKCSFFKHVELIFCEIDEDWVEVESIKKTLSSFGFQHFKKIGKKTHYDLLISKT
jgi:FkbM family methyltransferase